MDREPFSLLICFPHATLESLVDADSASQAIAPRRPYMHRGHLASVAAALLGQKRKNLMIHNRVLRAGLVPVYHDQKIFASAPFLRTNICYMEDSSRHVQAHLFR